VWWLNIPPHTNLLVPYVKVSQSSPIICLNLHRRFPERVVSYSGITKQGVLELGLEAGDEAQ
jgi:hypothetical protein